MSGFSMTDCASLSFALGLINGICIKTQQDRQLAAAGLAETKGYAHITDHAKGRSAALPGRCSILYVNIEKLPKILSCRIP